MVISLKSPAFKEGESIPSRHTCEGYNISPPLEWNNLPDDTMSMAIICEDPDAPSGLWTHWIIFNLPKDTSGLKEKIMPREEVDDMIKQGLNSWGTVGYRGPCPPQGTHRYFFRIYALDKILDLPSSCTRDDLLKKMENHILDQGVLMGTYTRI